MQTRGKFRQKYGTFSAYMKIPATDGYWPAFWLLNGSQSGSEVNTAEFDVSEIWTQFQGSTATLHNWSGGTDVQESGPTICSVAYDDGAYHMYSLVWTATQAKVYVDHTLCVTWNSSTFGSNWFAESNPGGAWMILQYAVGGAGQADPTVNATALVDRVEVDTSTDAP